MMYIIHTTDKMEFIKIEDPERCRVDINKFDHELCMIDFYKANQYHLRFDSDEIRSIETDYDII